MSVRVVHLVYFTFTDPGLRALRSYGGTFVVVAARRQVKRCKILDAFIINKHIIYNYTAAVAQWLERSPREREFVGSIPDRVIPKTL